MGHVSLAVLVRGKCSVNCIYYFCAATAIVTFLIILPLFLMAVMVLQ